MESTNKLRIKIPKDTIPKDTIPEDKIPESEVIGKPKESEPDKKIKKTQAYNCVSMIWNLFHK